MGFINETVTSLEDFITRLNTHLVAEGWTSDELDIVNGEWAISRDTIFAQARWERPLITSPSFGLYHSLGFIDTSTLPGNHTNDSGNGAVSGTDTTLITQRHVFVGSAPIQYWCFNSDSAPHYAHVVLQISPTNVVHLGFGLLDKIGNWTGGEYCYGFRQQTGFTTNTAILQGTCVLLDGLCVDTGAPQPTNMEEFAATVHLEIFPNQTGPRWGVAMGDQADANFGTDRGAGARQRLIGGFRGSMLARAFGRYQAAPTDGLIPMYPIACWYEDTSNVTVSVPVDMLMGWMQDVRGMNIKDFVIGDIVSVGGDSWHVFPTSRKGESAALSGTSAHQGIAYKLLP